MSLCNRAACYHAAMSKGLCSKHYSRLRRNGHPDALKVQPNPDLCVVDECVRDPIAKGMCSMHYTRQRRYGSVSDDQLVRIKNAGHKCGVKGCGHRCYAKLLCRKHYVAQQRREAG